MYTRVKIWMLFKTPNQNLNEIENVKGVDNPTTCIRIKTEEVKCLEGLNF